MNRVNGKVVQKYVGYLGKSPTSKNEIEPDDIMKYLGKIIEERTKPGGDR